MNEDFEQQQRELAMMRMESELRPVRELIARVIGRLPGTLFADDPMVGGPDPDMRSWLHEVRRRDPPRRVMMLRYDFGDNKIQMIRQTDDAGSDRPSYRPGEWPAIAPDDPDAEERLLLELDWLLK